MAKPASWTWAANKVINDGHRALAAKLTWLVPFWEGTGAAAELLTSAASNDGGGAWATSSNPSINGPVWRTTAAGHYRAWNSNTAFQMDGAIDFSAWVVIDKTGTNGSFPSYLANRTTIADGMWQIYLNGGILTVDFYSGSQRGMQGFGSDLTTGLHSLCWTRRNSDTQYRVYVDGVFRSDYNWGPINPVPGTHQFVVGGLGPGNDNQLGDYAMAAVFKGYELQQSDINLLQTGTAAGATHGMGLLQQGAPTYVQAAYRFYNDDASGLHSP